MRLRWCVVGDSERLRLPSGDFVDRAVHTWTRHAGYKYSVWRPGASSLGCALWLCGADTLAELRARYEAIGGTWETEGLT